MTQFCALFFGIYALLALQRGSYGTMPPLNTSLGVITLYQHTTTAN